VRAWGAAALTAAHARADSARYQEVTCRSALNAVAGMPFRWTLNPYRGCTHGCHYCFARRYHRQFELGAGDEFASVKVGVLMAPIVPGFSSSRAKPERTIKAIADHGARFVGCSVMHLEEGTRAHFMHFIEREFPLMRPRFERLYAEKHPPEAYRQQVKAMVRALERRYGLDAGPVGDASRPTRPSPHEAGDRPVQVGFAW